MWLLKICGCSISIGTQNVRLFEIVGIQNVVIENVWVFKIVGSQIYGS